MPSAAPVVRPSTSPVDPRLETPARSFMRPGVVVLSEDASLLQAERAMVRHDVRAVLLVGRSNGRPLGWVTDRGLLPWMGSDLALTPASRAITEPPTYVEPATTAREAVHLLSEPGVSHLLVSRMRGEPPQGVIAPLDLAALISRERP